MQIYATEREVATLRASGCRNNRLFDVVTPDNPLHGGGRVFGVAFVHHFLPVDGKGARDRSVLDDLARVTLRKRTVARSRATGTVWKICAAVSP